MKKKYIVILIAVFLIGTHSAKAQAFKNLFGISWEISVPINNNNFLDKTSLAGGKFEYRRFINKKFSLGGFINWNSGYQYVPKATYNNADATQAVTTDMYKYLYTAPFGVSGHYYFSTRNLINPFIGLGLGAQYSEQNLYFNIYESTSKNWGFFVRPELGIIITPHPWHNMSFLLGSGYSFSTNQNNNLGINNIQNLTFQLGLLFSE